MGLVPKCSEEHSTIKSQRLGVGGQGSRVKTGNFNIISILVTTVAQLKLNAQKLRSASRCAEATNENGVSESERCLGMCC